MRITLLSMQRWGFFLDIATEVRYQKNGKTGYRVWARAVRKRHPVKARLQSISRVLRNVAVQRHEACAI